MGHDIDATRVDRLLDAIYDAAVAPETWPTVLDRLAGVFNAGFVDIFTRSRDRQHFSGLAYGLDRSDYDDHFLGFWFKRNIWGTTRPVEIAGEVLSTRQMVDLAALRRSEIFNEYLDPRGLHEGLRLSIWVDRHEVQDISILRPWSQGAFGPAEVALGEVLLPHLQRAASVTRRLVTSGATINGVSAISSDLAVVMFDNAGKIVRSSPAAQRLLDDGRLISVDDGRLQGGSPAITALLQRLIARATGQLGGLRQGGSMQLHHSGVARPLTLVALPLSGQRDWATSRPPTALALLHDHAGLTLPLDLAKTAFALTDAEAQLAQHLLHGLTLLEIAARTRRSVHTVRSQLARLMEKTETKKQVDLVRILTNVAALDHAFQAPPPRLGD